MSSHLPLVESISGPCLESREVRTIGDLRRVLSALADGVPLDSIYDVDIHLPAPGAHSDAQKVGLFDAGKIPCALCDSGVLSDKEGKARKGSIPANVCPFVSFGLDGAVTHRVRWISPSGQTLVINCFDAPGSSAIAEQLHNHASGFSTDEEASDHE